MNYNLALKIVRKTNNPLELYILLISLGINPLSAERLMKTAPVNDWIKAFSERNHNDR